MDVPLVTCGLPIVSLLDIACIGTSIRQPV
jgi:hypothetical protein